MEISFKNIALPFKVGDSVFVNQPHSAYSQGKKGPKHPYFEAEVVRIFLDGRLEELTVITEPLDTFQLEVKTVVYDLKPINKFADLIRMPLSLSLPIKEPRLFKSESELLDYQKTITHLEDSGEAQASADGR